MPRISIIVPVYNVESYLPQCIDSIRKQTFKDFEVVCVVDGSTDYSEAILRLYSLVEPRIRIIVKENGGLSSARNAGIEASCAPLLMFVDSDDMLTSNACQAVVDAFDRSDAEVVTFGGTCYPDFMANSWYDKTLSPRDTYFESFGMSLLLDESSHPFVWRTAFKADFLEREHLTFDETVRFCEDEIFLFQMYPKARGIRLIPDKLYKYRLARKDSLMESRASNERARLHEHIVAANTICATWKDYGILEQHATGLLDWLAEFLLFNLMKAPNEIREDVLYEMQPVMQRWFTVEETTGMKTGVLPIYLMGKIIEGSLTIAEITKISKRYFNSVGYTSDSRTRPKWMNALRRVLPMSAQGLEDRLVNADLSQGKLQWLAQESGASAHCLELLRLELLSKNVTIPDSYFT